MLFESLAINLARAVFFSIVCWFVVFSFSKRNKTFSLILNSILKTKLFTFLWNLNENLSKIVLCSGAEVDSEFNDSRILRKKFNSLLGNWKVAWFYHLTNLPPSCTIFKISLWWKSSLLNSNIQVFQKKKMTQLTKWPPNLFFDDCSEDCFQKQKP